MKNGVYVASRASLPARPAMWRLLRSEGWPIVSSWIDEAGPGETADMCELWSRIRGEIASSIGLVLYVEREDFPLKGALVEAGIAIGLGKPVVVVLGGGLTLEPGSMRPLGSWSQHPLVEFKAMDEALDWLRWRHANPLSVGATDPAVVATVGTTTG